LYQAKQITFIGTEFEVPRIDLGESPRDLRIETRHLAETLRPAQNRDYSMLALHERLDHAQRRFGLPSGFREDQIVRLVEPHHHDSLSGKAHPDQFPDLGGRRLFSYVLHAEFRKDRKTDTLETRRAWDLQLQVSGLASVGIETERLGGLKHVSDSGGLAASGRFGHHDTTRLLSSGETSRRRDKIALFVRQKEPMQMPTQFLVAFGLYVQHTKVLHAPGGVAPARHSFSSPDLMIVHLLVALDADRTFVGSCEVETAGLSPEGASAETVVSKPTAAFLQGLPRGGRSRSGSRGVISRP
jgi:hypothetical protein